MHTHQAALPSGPRRGGRGGDVRGTACHRRAAAKIGRMTLDGTFTEYPLAPGASPQRIVAGPDGALWFTELGASTVDRITAETLTQYPVPGGPVGITAGKEAATGADLDIRVADTFGGLVDRVTPYTTSP